MEQAFKKDLSHTNWEEVYARQMLRADLVPEWMEAIHLKAGDRVLEVGAGPGYVSLLLADRVGPEGVVYAIDRSAEALAHLERRQTERGISQIRRIVADAAALKSADLQAALIAMLLHHVQKSADLLRDVHRAGGIRRARMSTPHPSTT